jgi:hypothetical protein
MMALHDDAGRRDLAWQLGIDAQVSDRSLRTLELKNFLRRWVKSANV